MQDFIIEEKDLSKIFLPIASFHDEEQSSSNEEIVAAIEGVVYPWFGLSYRIDRIQFSMEQSKVDQVDHSRDAILHAQKIANLFVDEARLSKNRYDYVSQEMDSINLILNNDPYLIKLPLFSSNDSSIMRTEMVFF